MAATDSRPVPRKNVDFRFYFSIHDTAGALISGATALDSEFSGDGAAFADCTNEATEIGSSGVYFLDLLAAEMNFDGVSVVVKTTSVNAIIPTFHFAPEEIGDYRVNVEQWKGTTAAAVDTAGYPVVTVKDGSGAGEINTASGAVFVDSAQLAAAVTAIIAGILVTPGQPIETDASGRVVLQPDGLDPVVIESSMNARQAISAIASAVAGVLAGAGTTGITIQAANDPGTLRISATVDAVGNRPTVALSLPA